MTPIRKAHEFEIRRISPINHLGRVRAMTGGVTGLFLELPPNPTTYCMAPHFGRPRPTRADTWDGDRSASNFHSMRVY